MTKKLRQGDIRISELQCTSKTSKTSVILSKILTRSMSWILSSSCCKSYVHLSLQFTSILLLDFNDLQDQAVQILKYFGCEVPLSLFLRSLIWKRTSGKWIIQLSVGLVPICVIYTYNMIAYDGIRFSSNANWKM